MIAEGDGGSPYRTLAAREIRGLARAHAGEAEAGRQLSGEMVAAAKRDPSPGFTVEALLVAAEASLTAGDSAEARHLVMQVLREGERLGEEEMAYRAALIAVEAARRAESSEILRQAQAAVAKHASALNSRWGAEAFTIYNTRPDLIEFRLIKSKE